MLPDWERQRLIDGLSGAELEVWESLGHPLTPVMRNRLDHWRRTEAQRAKEREAAEAARRKTLLAEADRDRTNANRARKSTTRRREVPKVYRKAHRRPCPPHGQKRRRAA